jgi:hypothetical protein
MATRRERQCAASGKMGIVTATFQVDARTPQYLGCSDLSFRFEPDSARTLTQQLVNHMIKAIQIMDLPMPSCWKFAQIWRWVCWRASEPEQL